MAASEYHAMSKEVENHIFRHNWIFRLKCMLNNQHCQSSGITRFLCKYYVAISDKLRDSFLEVLFLLLAVILSELHEKPWSKTDLVTEKRTYTNVWGTSLFELHALLSMSFMAFLVYSLPLPKWRTRWMAPIKIIFLPVVFCVMISWVNGRKYETLLQVNTSCLTSLSCLTLQTLF